METNLRRGTAGSRIMVLVLAAFFMAAGFLPAMAGGYATKASWQKGGMERSRHHRPVLGLWQDPEMVQQLELTEQQVKKLRDADFTSREKRLELKARLDRLHLEMDKAFSAEAVDQEAVLQLAENIAEARGSLFIQDVESRLAIGKILNADQMDKLKRQLWQEKKCNPKTGRKGRISNQAA
jgi:Spy/CpxP family protein refolding chaperone